MARVVKGGGRRPVILVRCLAVATLMLVPLLSGCGCSLFSRSARCQVVNGATVVALLPAIGVSRAAEGIHNASTRSALRKAVLADDLNAQARCLLVCGDYFDWRESGQLIARSVRHVLDAQDAAPSASALPMLMVAHGYRARELQAGDAQGAMSHWHRLAALSTDARLTTPEKLETWGHLASASYYTSLAVEAQAALMRLSRFGAGEAMLPGECRPSGPWPPAWLGKADSVRALQEACRDAQAAAHSARR